MSFLNSALNIELVYLILLGINKFYRDDIKKNSLNESQSDDNIDVSNITVIKETTNNMKIINFNKIEFENID